MPDLTREADAFLAEGLLKLESHEYAKAEDCLRKALRLNPQLARAHRALGQALSYQAAQIGDDPGRKATLLGHAELNVRRSEELQGEATVGTVHDLAWIYDERGTPEDLRKAIELYRMALERFGPTESPNNDLTPLHYNLACALTKVGDLAGAFEILSGLIGELWRGEAMRRSIERDADLEPLRQSPDFGEQLRTAIAAARTAEKNAADGGDQP